jgi:hypothetical protein
VRRQAPLGLQPARAALRRPERPAREQAAKPRRLRRVVVSSCRREGRQPRTWYVSAASEGYGGSAVREEVSPARDLRVLCRPINGIALKAVSNAPPIGPCGASSRRRSPPPAAPMIGIDYASRRQPCTHRNRLLAIAIESPSQTRCCKRHSRSDIVGVDSPSSRGARTTRKRRRTQAVLCSAVFFYGMHRCNHRRQLRWLMRRVRSPARRSTSRAGPAESPRLPASAVRSPAPRCRR